MNRLDLISSKYFDLKQNITTVLGRSSLKRYIVLDVERDYKNVIDLRNKMEDIESVVPSVRSNNNSNISNKSRSNPNIMKNGKTKNPNKGFL